MNGTEDTSQPSEIAPDAGKTVDPSPTAPEEETMPDLSAESVGLQSPDSDPKNGDQNDPNIKGN